MGPSQQEAFEDLKNRLSTTTVLDYPTVELTFILTMLPLRWQLRSSYPK